MLRMPHPPQRQKTFARKKIEFVAPDLSPDESGLTTPEQRWKYFHELSRKNRKWVNQHLPRGAHYLLVRRDGEIIQAGYSPLGTTIDRQVRAKWDAEGREYYILQQTTSPESTLDTIFFERPDALLKLMSVFPQAKEASRYEGNVSTQIHSFFGDAGSLSKLKKEQIALGKLRKVSQTHVAAIGGGATEVEITNQKIGVRLNMYMGSTDPKDMHLLSLGTIADNADRNRRYFVRLHRVDDPIIDIFDSWDIFEEVAKNRFGKDAKPWNPLVLYQHRLEI